MIYNKEEVCGMLNLSRVKIDNLIENGYIKTNIIKGFRYQMITQMEIDSFKARLRKEAKQGTKNPDLENWKKAPQNAKKLPESKPKKVKKVA
jgi:hypothetical protein